MDGVAMVLNAYIWGYKAFQACAWLKQVFWQKLLLMLFAYWFF